MSSSDAAPPATRRLRVLVGPAVVAGVAALVVESAVASGAVDSSNLTLVFMGFDQDRAQLITSLLIAGAAAAAATLATNKSGQATLAGLGVFAAMFLRVSLVETRNALRSTGADGSFDPIGWLSTMLTLFMLAAASCWIGAVLAQALRPSLIEAGTVIRAAVRSRRLDPRLQGQPLAVAVVAILLIVTVPVFGDMVNYTPDSRMLHGGGQPVGLIPVESTNSPAPDSGSPSPGASTRSPEPGPTRSVRPNQRPWLAWRPSGSGSVTTVNLPAPWTGGSATTDVTIYTPPGYDPNGKRLYPVLYEAPTGFSFWDSATNAKTALDTIIDRGDAPPMIMVFVSSGDGPYPDSECADSVDGRELMDTFISQTVVSYVDSHFLTIARADARAVTGFSQGGYCAAILPLRHPAVFATSIPFSGYFSAGADTANAKAPFGGNAAAMAAASPMVVATELPAIERAKLFFIVVAKPNDPFFGTEATVFEHLLAVEGYHYVTPAVKVGHGWDQVRQLFPAALEAWAAHLVEAGVF